MVAADKTPVAFVAFLAVVGHVDDDRILVLKPFDNLIYDRVVVKHSIIVVCEHEPLFLDEVRPLFAIVVGLEMMPVAWVTKFV